MLVKLIAMGLTPGTWKQVFQGLRQVLPELPFSAGMFSTPEEIEFFVNEFFPQQWERENPDFFLCDGGDDDQWPARLALLEGLAARGERNPAHLTLVVEGLEKPDARFMMGIQCHPERLAVKYPLFQRLFDAFVAASDR